MQMPGAGSMPWCYWGLPLLRHIYKSKNFKLCLIGTFTVSKILQKPGEHHPSLDRCVV